MRHLYYGSVNSEVGNFDEVHTCRDISRLRDWLAEKASNERIPYFTEGSHIGYIHNEDFLQAWDMREFEFD